FSSSPPSSSFPAPSSPSRRWNRTNLLIDYQLQSDAPDRFERDARFIADNKNNVVRREAILSRFWNTEDDYFASRSLDVLNIF
ncbi:MAG: hypothetical protein K6G84_00970, partial [Lachnospiraceae bacterium]|nr:hypothetical protein [Lachnospiraceae bacterium]